MQRAELILTKLYQKSKSDKTFLFKRIYRNLFNPDFYGYAYSKIHAKEGNMTEGVDGTTVDGFKIEWIKKTIELMKTERYKPKPVRRTYIPKKNRKRRPIGIPAFIDKLVQEAIRNILEAIYEPLFSNYSHGFRHHRSCQTTLYQIKKRCPGCNWAIEGDIKSFFDTIDHEILINMLKKKIDDGRFLELIKRFLKAGYMENGIKYNTITGTPQGGIISPILANIYLNEMDRYMEQVNKENRKGEIRAANKEYYRLSGKRQHRLENKRFDEAKEYLKLMRKVPRKDPFDPNFRRVKYVRYADDFVVFIWGPKSLAERIKSNIGHFLKQELKLELNNDKTLITNMLTGKVKFLGYEIIKAKDDSYITKDSLGRKRRSLNGAIQLLVPNTIIDAKLKSFRKNGKAVHHKIRLNLPIADMLEQYNAEIRGLYNYYSLANNVYKRIDKYKYFHFHSLMKTIARKEKTSVVKVKKKYGIDVPKKTGSGTRKIIGIKYKTKSGEKILTYFNESLCRKKEPLHYNVDPDVFIFTRNCQVLKRLAASKCEFCKKTGTPQDFEVHHIRKLKDVKIKYRKRNKKRGIPPWIQIMIKMNRKTLIVCKECHNKIHRGLI